MDRVFKSVVWMQVEQGLFFHFVPIFDVFSKWWFFFKNHQKLYKKWRKALFNLPLTMQVKQCFFYFLSNFWWFFRVELHFQKLSKIWQKMKKILVQLAFNTFLASLISGRKNPNSQIRSITRLAAQIAHSYISDQNLPNSIIAVEIGSGNYPTQQKTCFYSMSKRIHHRLYIKKR